MPKLYSTVTGETRAAVLGKVQELEMRPDTVARWAQHDEDEKLWNLEEYTLEEVGTFKANRNEYPSVTLNGPRTFYGALRRSLTANGPRISVELPPIKESTEAAANAFAQALEEAAKHERFLLGLLRDVDEVRRRRAMQRLQDNLAYWLGVRGGAITRVWLDPDEPHPLSVADWDPRTTVYEAGRLGLSFAAHHYYADKYAVLEQYPECPRDQLAEDGEGNVEVFDAWWLEVDEKTSKTVVYNGVYTGNYDLKPAEIAPKQDHLPIFVVRPLGPDIEGRADTKGTQDSTKKAWESIYTANRETYRWLNRTATLYSLMLRRNAIGAMAGRTGITDEAELKKALGPFGYVELPEDGVVPTPIHVPEMAAEVKEFFAFLQGAEQRGGIPYSVYGQIPFQLSGFAVNQLQGAVSIMAGPLATAMGDMYRLICDEVLGQFKARGKKITVKGVDQRRVGFIEDITARDINSKYYLDVQIEPELPTDKLTEAQIAQAWSSLGIDPLTISDEVLKVQDPRQLLQRAVIWMRLQQETAGMAPAPPQQAQAPANNVAGVEGNIPETPSADTGMGAPGGAEPVNTANLELKGNVGQALP